MFQIVCFSACPMTNCLYSLLACSQHRVLLSVSVLLCLSLCLSQFLLCLSHDQSIALSIYPQLMQVSSELGVVSFKVESLQCKIALNPSSLQSLHLKVSPTPGMFFTL